MHQKVKLKLNCGHIYFILVLEIFPDILVFVFISFNNNITDISLTLPLTLIDIMYTSFHNEGASGTTTSSLVMVFNENKLQCLMKSKINEWKLCENTIPQSQTFLKGPIR